MMSRLFALAAAAGSLFHASTALAQSRPRPSPTAVPEIDASTGLIAVAVVAALLALAWERRRRAAG